MHRPPLYMMPVVCTCECYITESDLHLDVRLPDSKVIPCEVPADATAAHVIANIKVRSYCVQCELHGYG